MEQSEIEAKRRAIIEKNVRESNAVLRPFLEEHYKAGDFGEQRVMDALRKTELHYFQNLIDELLGLGLLDDIGFDALHGMLVEEVERQRVPATTQPDILVQDLDALYARQSGDRDYLQRIFMEVVQDLRESIGPERCAEWNRKFAFAARQLHSLMDVPFQDAVDLIWSQWVADLWLGRMGPRWKSRVRVLTYRRNIKNALERHDDNEAAIDKRQLGGKPVTLQPLEAAYDVEAAGDVSGLPDSYGAEVLDRFLASLTSEQAEVARLLVKELSQKEVAAQLRKSESTISEHVRNIREKYRRHSDF